VLADSERVEGICLSCRAVPITNVVIELQEGDRLRRVLPYGFASAAATRAEPSGRPGQPVLDGRTGSTQTSRPRAEATSKGSSR
jgi:hypothetical protein